MKGKRRSIEEKVRILRKADGAQTVLQVCDEHNISEQTFYRWKKELGLLEVKQAKRLKELEAMALSYPGVLKTYAIQAGRELRVLVSARETDDSRAAKICRDIAKAFEEQLTYPGEIKITVVRESRFTEIAR